MRDKPEVSQGDTATSLSKKRLTTYKRPLLFGGIAFGLLLIGMMVGFWFFLPKQRINHSTYQIVYMTNGQAYFGKLQNTAGDYLVLRDPYTTQSTNAAGTDSKEQTATLVKVSNQVYGPEDSIAIKTTQVTFWQNLREDSKVTQAIKSKE